MNNEKTVGYDISGLAGTKREVNNEEVEKVVLEIQNGNIAARMDLINMMMRIVEARARAYSIKIGVDKDDLIQEGLIGLFDAVDHYDIASDNTFVTYATTWISNAMKKSCREQCGMIRIPASQRKISLAIRELQHEAETQGRSVPTSKEISELLNVKESTVLAAFLLIPTTLSLDEKIDEAGEISRGDMVESQAPGVWDLIEKETMISELRNVMSKFLTADECAVLTLHYGLAGELCTEVKIAEKLGKSVSRIWAIEKEAMRKIRANAPELRMFL